MNKKITVVFVLVFLSVCANALNWHSIKEMEHSTEAKTKPVMVVVYKEGCPYCERLHDIMESNQLVNSVAGDFYLVSIDVKDAQKNYGAIIKKTPTVIFINSKREEIVPQIEGLPADTLEFVEYMQKAKVIYSIQQNK